MRVRALAAVPFLFVALACVPRGPVVDTGSKPSNASGTVAGVVRATNDAVALVGRRVTAVDVKTGARHDVSTGTTGGYTLQLPVGTYRLEVELRAGETIVTQPSEVDLDTGDIDEGRDFEITVK